MPRDRCGRLRGRRRRSFTAVAVRRRRREAYWRARSPITRPPQRRSATAKPPPPRRVWACARKAFFNRTYRNGARADETGRNGIGTREDGKIATRSGPRMLRELCARISAIIKYFVRKIHQSQGQTDNRLACAEYSMARARRVRVFKGDFLRASFLRPDRLCRAQRVCTAESLSVRIQGIAVCPTGPRTHSWRSA